MHVQVRAWKMLHYNTLQRTVLYTSPGNPMWQAHHFVCERGVARRWHDVTDVRWWTCANDARIVAWHCLHTTMGHSASQLLLLLLPCPDVIIVTFYTQRTKWKIATRENTIMYTVSTNCKVLKYISWGTSSVKVKVLPKHVVKIELFNRHSFSGQVFLCSF